MSHPFLLLFRDTDLNSYRALSPSGRSELLQRWSTWFERLAGEGKIEHANPLELSGRTVSGRDGKQVRARSFAHSSAAVSGYFLLRVEDLDEATEIARQCPSLAHGMTVEVRPVGECCHLAKASGLTSREEFLRFRG